MTTVIINFFKKTSGKWYCEETIKSDNQPVHEDKIFGEVASKFTQLTKNMDFTVHASDNNTLSFKLYKS